MLSPRDVTTIRLNLGFTQQQLAQLLGVHHLTISKWERGVLAPNPHQEALLCTFRTASKRESDVGEDVARLLVAAGVAVALYALLRAALEDSS